MFSVKTTVKELVLKRNTSTILRNIHVTATCEAARKGTREKARKKKVKVEVKKVGFIPHNLRGKYKVNVTQVDKHVDDSWKAIPVDDVYVGKYYRWRVYSVPEAIECHRETHHPTMYNVPDAPLNAHIELNMQAEKATRFMDSFNRIATIPHEFAHGEERRILVFSKDTDLIREAQSIGATLAGGVELIKDIQGGEVQLADYQYILAHTNILPELVSLRGLMKRKFPNPRSGTLGNNLIEMIGKFARGISYSAVKDENQQNFGLITTCIGKLNMDKKHLEANLVALLHDINSIRPKREGPFITRVLLKSPPSSEQLKIDPFVYIPKEYIKSSNDKNLKKEHEESEEPDSLEIVN